MDPPVAGGMGRRASVEMYEVGGWLWSVAAADQADNRVGTPGAAF